MRRYATTDEIDFLIIGAGASGGILAWELSRRGHSVVVLEQGPFFQPSDFRHDEIDVIIDRRLMNNHDRQPNTFRKTEQEVAVRKPVVEYGRMVGGGSAHFTANYWRFHEIDFIEASKKGAIAGTGFTDWPITYADLEPYYTKAEWELGVSGDATRNPFDPPRSKPYPTPPLPIKSSGVLFEQGARKLGWHPAPAPMAIISQAYDGRPGCVHCGFCEYFGCEVGAKSSTLATVIPKAIATGRCEIRPESYVRAVEIDARGRATGATYFDAKRAVHHQRAKAVIVAANGSETPRLLLLSTSSRFPNGLANSSGLVGRYLMFTTGAFCGGLFERALNEYKSVQVTRIVHDFYEIDPKHGFYGGGGLDGRFDFYPMSFALNGLPPDIPKWGPGVQGRAGRVLHAQHVRAGARDIAARPYEFHLARSDAEGRLGPARDAGDLQGPPGRHEDDAVLPRPWAGTAAGRRCEEDLAVPGRRVHDQQSPPGHVPDGQRIQRPQWSMPTTARTMWRTCSSATAAASSRRGAVSPPARFRRWHFVPAIGLRCSRSVAKSRSLRA